MKTKENFKIDQCKKKPRKVHWYVVENDPKSALSCSKNMAKKSIGLW
jgi:hypothetical protein